MGETRQRVVLGLGAAVAAVGAAAMISGATAPAAHADDTATILADISAIETAANTAFTTGEADLGSPATEAAGLTQIFTGLDDDLFGIPSFLDVAYTDEAAGDTIIPPTDFEIGSTTPFDFSAPTSLTQSVTEANTIYVEGATTLVNEINALPTSDVTDTALYNAWSVIDQFILPDQVQLIADLAYAF
jgi:hypothetical protein